MQVPVRSGKLQRTGVMAVFIPKPIKALGIVLFAILLGGSAQGASNEGAVFPALDSGPAPTNQTQERMINTLDVKALPSGHHKLTFRAGATNTGQPIMVPVHVIKGAQDGPRFLVVAGVHGDELNGIATLHGLFDEIDAATLKGSVVAIPGLNQPGLAANNRHYVGSAGGGFMTDLNRIFPGKPDSGDSAERYVSMLWNHIIKDNADFAVDLHTQTRGSSYPLFVFADFNNATAREMAKNLIPDAIKNDQGQRGTLETSLLTYGIPAVTYEIGGPKSWQPALIGRAVHGLLNLMIAAGMIEGDQTSPEGAPYIGDETTNVYTDVGGYAYLHVGLKDRVEEGDPVATVKNAYGETMRRYYAPISGYILSVATDPLSEPGAMLVRILH